MQSLNKSLESLSREEKLNVCPDCGSKNIEFEKGERFCKRCGLVFD
ncbi:hypothetical protein HYX01_00010 [Candidatus Woesearchaeota archaeon]|nr:hypothetical protein [Candidatus Woesearchaeota archaeon]